MWQRLRPITGALTMLVLAGVIVTGCTARQSEDEYEQRLEHVLGVREEVSGQLSGHQLTTQQQYDQASSRVNQALDELDEDAPPKNLEDAHERMIDGLDGLATLLQRLGRCETLSQTSQQDGRACRASIGQGIYDSIRNDFTEADTIYRQEGISLAGLGSEDGQSSGGDSLGQESPEGGDEL